MKKQIQILAIMLLISASQIYSSDDTNTPNTKNNKSGVTALVSQSSGVGVTSKNSCFGRPAGTFEATVNDENGTPSIGASILIVGTTKGAYIKANGVGTVPNLSKGIYTVKISYAVYSSVLDTVNIEYGDTLKKSYELDEFVTSGCYFYCERIVDAYEIGSVTKFSSSEIQGRGWGASKSLSSHKKSTESEPEEQQISIDSSNNFADLLSLKTSCGVGVVVKTNEVENNPFAYQDISDYIKVYPNPTEGPFTIELEEEIDNLIIVDMNGNVVLELSPKIGINQINLSDISSGIYFLKYNYKGNWGS